MSLWPTANFLKFGPLVEIVKGLQYSSEDPGGLYFRGPLLLKHLPLQSEIKKKFNTFLNLKSIFTFGSYCFLISFFIYLFYSGCLQNILGKYCGLKQCSTTQKKTKNIMINICSLFKNWVIFFYELQLLVNGAIMYMNHFHPNISIYILSTVL